MYGLKADDTRRQYPGRLKRFFDFIRCRLQLYFTNKAQPNGVTLQELQEMKEILSARIAIADKRIKDLEELKKQKIDLLLQKRRSV